MGDDLQSKAADLVKKVLTVGVGAVFLTEESLRNLTADFKLPKELLTGLLDSASKTKNEFFQNLSNELITRILEKADPKQLVQELLANNTIEVKAEIKLTPRK